jgi:hypothetical protein
MMPEWLPVALIAVVAVMVLLWWGFVKPYRDGTIDRNPDD